jgi:4-hydroxythreonine-4-phosphate dehydrogenase
MDYLNQELEGMLNVDGARQFKSRSTTDHIPVSEVASRLTEDLIIEKLKQ